MRTNNKVALLAVNAMLASCAITIAWANPSVEPWANSETTSAGQLKAAINQQPPALDIATGAEIPSEGSVLSDVAVEAKRLCGQYARDLHQ